MTFTSLHRALGLPPGPLTYEMLLATVANGVVEGRDLDWKAKLPPAKALTTSDFPKDIAAMANSGGGLIVFGVREEQKAATELVDVGEFDENYERTLHSAAITAISPPVLGLSVHRISGSGFRAVAVEVPASVDGPHLIFRDQFFGAPIRNDADTAWMRERDIEGMYRARFDERRHAAEAMDRLFDEASFGRDTGRFAWFIATACPRVVTQGAPRSRDDARRILMRAEQLTLLWVGRAEVHPLENVGRDALRPGLRRWVAPNIVTGERQSSSETWISVHHDGSVSLAAAVGGKPIRPNVTHDGSETRSRDIECAVADFMALLRATAEADSSGEYELRVGIAWSGSEPMTILTSDQHGYRYDDVSTPLYRYTPIESTVNALEPDLEYYWRVHDLAQECINQGGISNVQLIQPPARRNQDASA